MNNVRQCANETLYIRAPNFQLTSAQECAKRSKEDHRQTHQNRTTPQHKSIGTIIVDMNTCVFTIGFKDEDRWVHILIGAEACTSKPIVTHTVWIVGIVGRAFGMLGSHHLGHLVPLIHIIRHHPNHKANDS